MLITVGWIEAGKWVSLPPASVYVIVVDTALGSMTGARLESHTCSNLEDKLPRQQIVKSWDETVSLNLRSSIGARISKV